MTSLSGANLHNGAAVGPQGECRDSPSNFPPYPAYKDSGVAWLGYVPEHWNVLPVKWVGLLKGGAGFPHDKQGVDSHELDFHKVNALASADSAGVLQSSENTITRETAKELGAYIFPKGTIVFAKVGAALLLGRLRTISAEACIDNNMMGLIAFKGRASNQFVLYSMGTVRFDLIANPGAVPSLNEGQIGNYRLAIPSLPEQTQIARFLDHETARIDALIEEQQRLIELLKEKRQAVISHAVTKGLDPTVPMKDSGVEWLGEVPEHWDVVSLKRLVVFQRGHDLPSESREEGNVPIISSGGYSGTHSVACAKAPGIVTGRYGSIGQFILATKDYWPLNTALYSIELYGNRPRYVWYLLQGYAEHFLLNSLKSAVPGVDRNDIHVVKVVAAPVEEQDQIVIYIDRISNQLDQLVDAAEKNVTLLQERRSALISAAVTGKIDVRGWQPPASTQAPELAVAEAV